MNKEHAKILLLTAIGGALEFYDFTIYALFAPYISQHFFPNANPLIGLINTFAVFALGYFARPLGGIVLGHRGDRYGRKSAFSLAVLIMAIATLLMGCLPDYQTIGIAAPLILIGLRLVQGFSVGGEIPGTSIFIVEHLPEKQHGLSIGLAFMSITLGNTLGAAMGLLLTTLLNQQQMLDWGWRIAFVSGFFLGMIGFIIRKKAQETPVFTTIVKKNKILKSPLVSISKVAKKQLMVGILLTALTSSIVSLFLYLPTYLSNILNIKIQDAYLVNVIGFSSFAIMTALFGWLSDHCNRKKLFLIGIIALMIMSFPLFFGLTIFGESFIWIFILSFAFFGAMINGSYMVILTQLFPARFRYTGVGLSYSFGVAVFSGLAPLLFTYLIHVFNQSTAPAYYIIFCAAFTLFATFNTTKVTSKINHVSG